MNRRDFLKVVGADQQSAEYLPVACLLRSGYGCVGYFNSTLNTALDEVCTLLNVRVMGFGDNGSGREHAVVKDFNEFLEDVVMEFYKAGGRGESSIPDVYGKSIPLSCIRYDEIAILYPVAQIGRMMQMLSKVQPGSEPMVDAQKQAAEIVKFEQGETSKEKPNVQTAENPIKQKTSDTAKSQPAKKKPTLTQSKGVHAVGSPDKPVEPFELNGTAEDEKPSQPQKSRVVATDKLQKAVAESIPDEDSIDIDDNRFLPEVVVDKDMIPAFLDFDKRSVVLQVLRKKIW